MSSPLQKFTLRIPSQLIDKLKYVADHNGRSANREIEHIIQEHIDTWETAHGPIPLDGASAPPAVSSEPSH
ncbi:MAG: Arc family DNA-binding protein [Lachnospiraceae bacterium]|jgi:predicted DNA-binding protein|nr:Arc family DNA-binding protein [Lachnospiraceae bacterium]